MSRARRDAIVALATPLADRLAGRYVAERAGRGGDEAVERALDRWRAVVADGRQDLFLRRLEWDGWQLDAVRRCLAPGRISRRHTTGWLATLHAISSAASGAAGTPAGPRWQDASRPIAFEDVFVPHVAVASQNLRQRCTASGLDVDVLAASAWRDLRRGLVQRLSGLLGHGLMHAFARHRGFAVDPVRVLMAAAAEVKDSRRYASFVQELHRDGLRRWHHQYPVAARLAATAVDAWVDTTFEMLSRFAEDTPLLQREFGAAFPGRIDGIRAGLSDPHSGGRSVHVLTCGDGVRLVYKPRALGVDAAFMRFLDWCNARGAPLPLETHRVVDRGEYGWAQFVDAAPCADAGAAERCHRRAGMLLGVFYVFGSSDCHFENFVVRGEQWHLIDAEALLPLALRKWGVKEHRGDGWYEASARLGCSVLSTGMLPQWQPAAHPGGRFNIGALGGGAARRDRGDTWFNINTDQMGRLVSDAERPMHPNVAVLDGEALNPADYVSAIVDGFHEMYGFLLRHRPELVSPAGPLSIPGVFSTSSMQALRTRLQRLDDGDRQYQASLIRAALRSLGADRADVVAHAPLQGEPAGEISSRPRRRRSTRSRPTAREWWRAA